MLPAHLAVSVSTRGRKSGVHRVDEEVLSRPLRLTLADVRAAGALAETREAAIILLRERGEGGPKKQTREGLVCLS